MASWRPWRDRRLDRAVTASAMVLDSDVRRDSKRRMALDWQDRSLHYARIVGEAWFGSQFYARALPKLQLLAGEITYDEEKGQMVTQVTKNKKAIDTLHEIRDAGGGLERFMFNYGRLMFGPGEGMCVGTIEDGERTFRFLSHKEVKVKGSDPNTYQIRQAPNVPVTEYHAVDDSEDKAVWETITDQDAIVARFWRPDAEYSWLADSPMQPALDTCEEIKLLTATIHAKATSRLSGAGILYVPNSVADAIPNIPALPGEEASMPPMMRLISRAMLHSVANPGTASQVVPIVLTGPDEMGDKIKHIVLYSNEKEWPEAVLRERAVERYAVGADFPMEYLVGLKNLNHWNAWQVDDATWGGHVQPVAEMLVGDMTRAIYRPMLEAKGMSPEEAAGFCIMYDESEVVTRPDKTAPTLDAYKAGIASRLAVLREAGLDPDDEMVDEEYRKWVGVQLQDAKMAVTGEPTEAPTPAPAAPPPPAPTEDPEAPPEQPTKDDSSASARVLGAAEMAVLTCREKAGNRLATLARRCPPCAESIKGVARSQVCEVLGPDALENQPNAGRLVAGGAESFLQQCALWGMDLSDAAYFAGAVERHAASTLYDEQWPGVPSEILTWVEGAQRGV